MITALDHVAVAVPDLEKAIKRFVEDFGLTFDGKEDAEAAKTSTAFFPLPPTSIELIHPLRGEGPVEGTLPELRVKPWKRAAAAYIISASGQTTSTRTSSVSRRRVTSSWQKNPRRAPTARSPFLSTPKVVTAC